LYFLMYRQHGSFMETIVNQIFEDLSSVCNPQWMQIIGEFNARGGTKINVQVEM
jgi:7-cyano-7-deazaguanine reductase